MPTTKEILERDNYVCQYCGGRAVQRDHFVKKAHTKRVGAAKLVRDYPEYQCAVCRLCNESIGTRCFVPESYAELIPELEAITFSKYGTFNGDPATLRTVLA